MIGQREHAARVWPSTLIPVFATAALLVPAAFIMFSAFMIYDDEGYVLFSLRNFAQHGGLYRDVYSQYGPFPFVVYHAFQLLGLPLTHTVGRLITLGMWAGAAWCCASVVAYETRSIVMRLAVLTAAFLYLWIMSSEPTHPGGLIVLMTGLLAVLGYRWICEGRLQRWATCLGAIAAALLLTKINIGAFVAFSAGGWWLLHHQHDTLRKWAPALVAVGGALLPVALMRPLLHTAWVQTYALAFACSTAAIAVAAAGAPGTRTDGRTLIRIVLAGVMLLAVVLGVVLLRGSSPRDLLEGLILGPLRQPTNFSLGYKWPPATPLLVAASLAACIVARLLKQRGSTRVDGAIAWGRLMAAGALAIEIARYPSVSPDYNVFGFALPCLWLFVWPLPDEKATHTSARIWLSLLLLGQCLHIFPVPGSQIAWGTFLSIPLAGVGGYTAVQWILRRDRNAWWNSSSAVAIAGRVLMIGFFALTSWNFATAAGRFRGGQKLGLPGAELIRVPDKAAALVRVLTHNAAAHADMLFSLPGMFSFNVWTELPAPTLANVTHWFSLLDQQRQRAIANALETHPRACVIVDLAHLKFLEAHHLTARGLLYDYLQEHFEPAFTVGHFEFQVHRGRKIEPFMVADLLTRSSGADSSGPTENTLLRFALLLPPSRPIARVEIFPDGEGIAPTVLQAGNARAETSAVNSRGESMAAGRPAAWPITLAAPTMLSIYFQRDLQATDPRPATLVLRDQAGTEIGLARLRL